MIPSIFRLSLLLLLAGSSAFAQDPLPRSLPEREGVSAAAISQFLDATTHGKTEFHSFMFLRHGKVIAEGWWNPYAPGLKHTLYSTSKSFTAAAVGFALDLRRQLHPESLRTPLTAIGMQTLCLSLIYAAMVVVGLW